MSTRADVLIGIDCGGTRATISVRGADGSVERRRVPASLSGLLPVSAYAATLDVLLGEVEDLVGSGTGPATLFVAAAAYTPATREALADAFRSVVPTRLDGAITVAGVANDSGALLLGHDADVVLIAGTGSNVLLRDRDGTFHQVGGQEWVVADEGSGFWIGLRGLRRGFADHRDDVDSPLRQRLVDHFGGADAVAGAVRDLAIAGPTTKRDIASFAEAVTRTAADGDPVAAQIVREEAGALAAMTATALHRYLGAGPVPALVACGGTFADDLVRTTVEDGVVEAYGPVTWIRVPDGAEATLNLAARLAEHGVAAFDGVPAEQATAIAF